jgi:hypothetical protein
MDGRDFMNFSFIFILSLPDRLESTSYSEVKACTNAASQHSSFLAELLKLPAIA